MMLVAAPPPAIESACDPAQRSAEIARLDDQAFVAMRAAVEAVDAAANRGASAEGQSDRLWSDYKRLRLEAARLRDLPCAATSQAGATPSTPAPSTQTALLPPAVSPVPAPEAAKTVAYVPEQDLGSRRFKMEVSAFSSDRQPSSASRVGVQTRTGTVIQTGSTVRFFPNQPVIPPPIPDYPAPAPGDGNLLTGGTVGPARDGQSAHIRSWSSGLNLAVQFAPDGLADAGWRFGVGLYTESGTTKSSTRTSSGGYQSLAAPNDYFNCIGNAFTGYACYWVRESPVAVDQFILPTVEQPRGELQDNLIQKEDTVEVRLSALREFDVPGLPFDLRARVGAGLSGGWWAVDEHETMRFFRPVGIGYAAAYARDANGPIGMARLDFGLGGPLWGPLNWSVDSYVGSKMVDLTYTSRVNDGASVTRQDREATPIGGLSGRIDFVSVPWNAFVAVERRRDVSIVSAISAPSARARADAVFPDGSTMGLWPVYSSRLMLGLGYSF